MKRTFLACSLSLLAALTACSSCGERGADDTAQSGASQTARPAVAVPDFNAQNAYQHIAKQLTFGPRVPGTPAQKACADWMAESLRALVDTVYVQEARVRAGNGIMLPCYNIIGAINPQASRRILLMTHWDSRPWADMDAQSPEEPVLAADDGASGVGVLLELARVLQAHPLPENLGIDIFFTDVEDYGRSEWGENSYCLGTQYWARQPHVPGYKAEFGILLDMVGARGARFPMEANSTRFAADVQQMVWNAASRAGYSSYFPFVQGSGVTDDHVFVNQMTGIPTIDIINLQDRGNQAFGQHWHTHSDNLDIIDPNTLKAVGQTLLQVLYETAGPV
jgi:glutaminyl-peptide cyclotransferase